jgi:peptide/nickel transport system substrate-binding protein
VRALALAAAVSCLGLLAGCWGGSVPAGTRPTDPQRGGTLTLLVPHADPSPDPHRVRTAAEAMIHAAVYRSLYAVRPARGDVSGTPDAATSTADEPVPDLAESPPEVSADGREITIRIRSGVRFGGEDARQITARDVARGIERAVADPVAGPEARRLLAPVVGVPANEPDDGSPDTIAGIEAIGKRTLRLQLRSPEARLVIAALATPLSTPIPADREDVTPWTGPYMPQHEGPDDDVVLVRNPSFHPLDDDWRKTYAERVRLEVDASPGAAARVLEGEGLVLGASEVPSDVARIAARRDQLVRVVMPTTQYVALNPGAGPFANEDLRKAAIAAIDRQALLTVAGTGGLLASHWLPPGTPGHDESGGAEGPRYDYLASPTGDLDVARAYLQRAGFTDGTYQGPALVADTAGDPSSRAVADAVRDQLARVGFDVRVRVVARAEAQRACADPSSGVALCPNDVLSSPIRDPEALLRPGFADTAARMRLGAGDIPALMTLAAEARPGEQRARAWGDINRDILGLAPGAPWRWDERSLLVSADVRGVVNDGIGGWDLAATSLENPRGG